MVDAPARTIKKYPNRRLYDTWESRYLTVGELQKLVVDEIDFVVVDKNTGQDITLSLLLQVICAREKQDAALLSREFLLQVIRSYEGAPPRITASFLEQMLNLFIRQVSVPHGNELCHRRATDANSTPLGSAKP